MVARNPFGHLEGTRPNRCPVVNPLLHIDRIARRVTGENGIKRFQVGSEERLVSNNSRVIIRAFNPGDVDIVGC